jgi:hypothetical protein
LLLVEVVVPQIILVILLLEAAVVPVELYMQPFQLYTLVHNIRLPLVLAETVEVITLNNQAAQDQILYLVVYILH